MLFYQCASRVLYIGTLLGTAEEGDSRWGRGFSCYNADRGP